MYSTDESERKVIHFGISQVNLEHLNYQNKKQVKKLSLNYKGMPRKLEFILCSKNQKEGKKSKEQGPLLSESLNKHFFK